MASTGKFSFYITTQQNIEKRICRTRNLISNYLQLTLKWIADLHLVQIEFKCVIAIPTELMSQVGKGVKESIKLNM